MRPLCNLRSSSFYRCVRRRFTRVVLPVLLLASGALFFSCSPTERYDLAVTHARVFDVHSGSAGDGATILIRGDRIARVVPSGVRAKFSANHTLDAAGRLVTPGLVDVHFHAGTLLADSISLEPDSLPRYREKFARAYLPYGVTTVRSCGDTERWLPMLRGWMHGEAGSPDFYGCGGALVSPNDRNFPGHVVVDGPDAARVKVREYHDAGLRHLKVYWRLREPEFVAVMDEARALGMNVTGHVDYKVIGIGRAMELGLRQFEHAYTLGVNAIDSTGYAYINGAVFSDHYASYIKDNSVPGSFFISRAEVFNYLGADHPAMQALIDSLHARGAGVTPTLHVFAQRFGLAYFTTPSARAGYDDTEALADSALARCRAGYRIMAGYVSAMFKAGIPLTVGSDWADPGKACLSEMLLLHECGIPIADVLIAATWNGAKEMGIEAEAGSIEAGKKANLIVFDEDPLADPRHLLGKKIVIKSGVLAEE